MQVCQYAADAGLLIAAAFAVVNVLVTLATRYCDRTPSSLPRLRSPLDAPDGCRRQAIPVEVEQARIAASAR